VNWINVNDAVPPDDRRILLLYHFTGENFPSEISIGWRKIYKNGKVKWKAFTWSGTTILCTDNEVCFKKVTHWAKLPEFPTK